MLKNKIFFFRNSHMENLNTIVADFFDNHSYNPISTSLQEHDGIFYAAVTARPIGEPVEEDEPETRMPTGEELFNSIGYSKMLRINGNAIFTKPTSDWEYRFAITDKRAVFSYDNKGLCIDKAEMEACLQVMKELGNGNDAH